MQYDNCRHMCKWAPRVWYFLTRALTHFPISTLKKQSMGLNVPWVSWIKPNGPQCSYSHKKVPVISREARICAEPSKYNHALTHIWCTLYEQWLFGWSARRAEHTHSPLMKWQEWQEVYCWRWPFPCLPSTVSFFNFHHLNSIFFSLEWQLPPVLNRGVPQMKKCSCVNDVLH